MTLTSLFAQPDKGADTATVSEQNSIGGSEQNSVSFGTLGDAFTQILQEAFGGNVSQSSSPTPSPNTGQSVQQKNSQAGEQVAKNQIQTASFLEANSTTVPNTTPNQATAPPLLIGEEAKTNVDTTAQSPRLLLPQVAIDKSQTGVSDTADTTDTQAATVRLKPKLSPRSDKKQAEAGPVANGIQPLKSAADPSTKLIVPIEHQSQTAPSESSPAPNPSAKIANLAPGLVPPDVSKNGSQAVTDTVSQQTGTPWPKDNASDKDVFRLSLQSSNSQDQQTKQTDQIIPQSANAVLSTQPKAGQSANSGAQNATDRSAIGSSKFDKVQAPPGASGDNSGMNSDSESASPKSSPLLGKDRGPTDGERKSEPIDGPLAGTTFAMAGGSFGLGVNPVSGKQLAPSAQSSAVNLPTDLQQAAAGSSAKEVTVRLQGDSGETISIRLTDQSGQVQVAVRSSDAGSVASLRQDLSSLTSNLDRIGWKTEVSNNVMASNNMSGQNSSGSGSNSRDDSRSGSLDWEQGSRRQRNSTPDLWDEVLYRQSN